MYEGFLLQNRICNLCGVQGKVGINTQLVCFSCGACHKHYVDPYAVPLKTFVREVITEELDGEKIEHLIPKVNPTEIAFEVDNAFAVWHNINAQKEQLASRKVEREAEWDWSLPQTDTLQ